MKRTLKLIASSLVLFLMLVTPQLTHASDEDLNDNNGLVALPSTSELVQPSLFEELPKDLRILILKDFALDSFEKGKTFGEVATVNKQWKNELLQAVKAVVPWDASWKAHLGITDANEAVFRQFYDGVLEYRNFPEDVKPALTLRFADLMNLFSNRTFDLSVCRFGSNHYRITTSPGEFFKCRGDNEDKIVILATPYGVIKNLYADTFSDIIEKWDPHVAPVGLFWRWGNNDTNIAPVGLLWRWAWYWNWGNDTKMIAYDSLVTSPAQELSVCNLYKNWTRSQCVGERTREMIVMGHAIDKYHERSAHRRFTLHF